MQDVHQTPRSDPLDALLVGTTTRELGGPFPSLQEQVHSDKGVTDDPQED